MSTGTGHSSFVYPVRSLLTGNILPAAQGEQPPADHQPSRRRRKRNARGLGPERVPSPNFRHYPPNDAAAELSFATAPLQATSKIVINPPSSTSPIADHDNVSFCTAAMGTGSPLSESSPRHPPNFTEVTSDVFSSSAANLELCPHGRRPKQVNMSDTSIVHLPPPPSALRLAHGRGIPTHSCSSGQQASDPHPTSYSSCSSSQHTQSLYGSLPSSHEDDTSFTVNLEGSLAPPVPSSSSVGSGSDAPETGRSGGSSSGYPSSDEPLVTFRFEHREDSDGHHVVIGREGKLSRCEDEVRTFTSCVMSVLSHWTHCICTFISPLGLPDLCKGSVCSSLYRKTRMWTSLSCAKSLKTRPSSWDSPRTISSR